MHVVPSLEFGGLERLVVHLARGLTERGYGVSICAPASGAFEPILVADAIRVVHISRPGRQPWGQLRAALGVAACVSRFKPSVIHAHNPACTLTAWLGRAFAFRARTPIVATYQGLPASRLAAAARILGTFADHVVGCGDGATAEIVAAGVPDRKASSIPNAVIIPAVTRSASSVREEFGAQGMPLLINVGRYTEQKNQHVLLEAAAEMRRQGLTFRLLIVGAGPLEGRLRLQALELGLENVVITGGRADVLDLVAASDVFVLPSLWEGLPLAALEAMGLARPVVGTRVRGLVDLIDDRVTGLLVEPGSARDLASALADLIRDDRLRGRLGAAGATLVARAYSADLMVGRYVDVYRRALAGSRTLVA